MGCFLYSCMCVESEVMIDILLEDLYKGCLEHTESVCILIINLFLHGLRVCVDVIMVVDKSM